MRGLIAALVLFAAAPVAAQEVEIAVTVQPDGARTLTHEVVIPAPAAEVWTAVGTAEGWRTWGVPLSRDVPGSPDRFETGYDPDAPPGSPTTIEQQWVERDPPRSATFRTTRTPQGFPHAETYLRVVSRFDLTPVDADTTRVRLTGEGYAAGPEGDALIGFFREGNRMSLEQLYARFAAPAEGD